MQWGSDLDAVRELLEDVGPEEVIRNVLGSSGAEVPLWSAIISGDLIFCFSSLNRISQMIIIKILDTVLFSYSTQ